MGRQERQGRLHPTHYGLLICLKDPKEAWNSFEKASCSDYCQTTLVQIALPEVQDVMMLNIIMDKEVVICVVIFGNYTKKIIIIFTRSQFPVRSLKYQPLSE